MMRRLHYLENEYPVLCRACGLLPFASVYLATGPDDSPHFPMARDLTWPVYCLLALAALLCVHFYGRARERLQRRARRVDRRIEIGKDLCFASPELQASYERSRGVGLFWSVNYTLNVLQVVTVHFRLASRQACSSAVYRLWLLPALMVVLCMAFYRRRLSSSTHSVLSLAGGIYLWASHILSLLSGDLCFGSINSGRGSIVLQTLIPCGNFISMSIMTPVFQAWVPLKITITFLCCLPTCYMHLLFRDGALDQTVDNDLWGFFLMLIGLSFCAMLNFLVSTWLSEWSMTCYLRSLAVVMQARDARR